jgi:methylated-DNA-protein-cysteine methyltransferase-like protein
VGTPNAFTLKVFDVIRAIPRGRVATYRQVAGLAGKIHASRGVAWILNSSSKKYKLPWQRVVSSQGKISFKPGTRHFLLQRRLLKEEGVEVDLKNGHIDMPRFQYRKMPKKPKPRRNQPRMFS